MSTIVNPCLKSAWDELNMTKVYTFYQDSWWDSVCDCCEAVEMVYYESNDTDLSLGTPHSEEDCYVVAIVSYLGRELNVDEVLYKLYEYPFEELLALCDKLGIVVEIVGEDDD